MATASPDSSNCSNVLASTTLLKSSLGSATKIIYHYKHIKLKHIDHNCCNLYYFVCVFFILWFFSWPKSVWLLTQVELNSPVRPWLQCGWHGWTLLENLQEFKDVPKCVWKAALHWYFSNSLIFFIHTINSIIAFHN